jgi:hypothetical protein
VKAYDWTETQANGLADRQAFLTSYDLQHLQPEVDALALHCFARVDNATVGYLRINAGGELSLIGAEKSCRDTIIPALQRFAVLESPRHNLPHLTAHSLFGHLDQLQALGFNKDNDQWLLMLPPDRSHQSTGSDLVRLEHIDDFRKFSVQLVNSTQRNLAIYSEDMEAWLYDHEDFVSAVIALAQKSRFSDIRIIVRDTRALIEKGHRLLRASHRASDKIHFRKLANTAGKQPCYLLADDCGLLLRPDNEIINGIGYTDYRGRVKPLREEFDTLWNSAYEDADLRRVTV